MQNAHGVILHPDDGSRIPEFKRGQVDAACAGSRFHLRPDADQQVLPAQSGFGGDSARQHLAGGAIAPHAVYNNSFLLHTGSFSLTAQAV